MQPTPAHDRAWAPPRIQLAVGQPLRPSAPEALHADTHMNTLAVTPGRMQAQSSELDFQIGIINPVGQLELVGDAAVVSSQNTNVRPTPYAT